MNQFRPHPRVFPFDRFEFFRKNRGDIRESRCTTGINDTGGKFEGFFHFPNLELRISPRIFEKIRNDPNGIIRGLGETDSRKKPEAKNLVTLSL
jgi:hypothetical protein